jgi:PhnB protein
MYVPPGFAVVTPYLDVPDAAGYVDFLKAAFGAEEIGRTVIGGRIANAQLNFSGVCTIMVSEAPDPAQASRAALYLYVADADATMAQAVGAGATAINEVGDRPYDDRQGGVRDPAGNTWWISQRLVEAPYF